LYNTFVAFQLPSLGAGNPFVNAELSLRLSGINLTFAWNADVYAVGVQNNNSVATDPAKTALSAMVVATPLDATKTLLKDDLTTQGSNEPLGLKLVSGTTLTDALNAAYDNGNNAGKYLFFRINPDSSALSDNQRFAFSTTLADHTLTYHSDNVPVMNWAWANNTGAAWRSYDGDSTVERYWSFDEANEQGSFIPAGATTALPFHGGILARATNDRTGGWGKLAAYESGIMQQNYKGPAWGLYIWKKNAFPIGSAANQTVRFDGLSSLRMATSSYGGATGSQPQIRFAVKDGDQYYVSADFFGGASSGATLGNPNDKLWYLLAPTAGDINSLILDKGQTPAAHTFADIQSAGLYIEGLDFATGSGSPYACIKSFSVNALVDDPPAGTVLLLK